MIEYFSFYYKRRVSFHLDRNEQPSQLLSEHIFNLFWANHDIHAVLTARTHNIFWWECAVQSWKLLPYFRPKYTIFRALFPTWLSKCIIMYVWKGVQSGTSVSLTLFLLKMYTLFQTPCEVR